MSSFAIFNTDIFLISSWYSITGQYILINSLTIRHLISLSFFFFYFKHGLTEHICIFVYLAVISWEWIVRSRISGSHVANFVFTYLFIFKSLFILVISTLGVGLRLTILRSRARYSSDWASPTLFLKEVFAIR